jgi:hypothetical protein
MNDDSLDERRTRIEQSIDSGEFFLSGLKQKLSLLQAKRDALKSTLNGLESEERNLKVKQNKLQGLLISQDSRQKREIEDAKAQYKSSEELLWASRFEKEEKCKKLALDIESIRKRRGLASRPSLT